MYTLRIIEETRENETDPFEQVIENFELGNSYSRIRSRTKEFNRIVEDLYSEESDIDEIESIICAENEKIFFIEKNETNRVFSYFIMTDSGKTFEKLY